MANRWENNGNSDRLYFGGLQNHYRWYCGHEIKRRLLLRRKLMTNLDSTLKSRDITLPTKVRLVKATVFPVVMHGCKSWTWLNDFHTFTAPWKKSYDQPRQHIKKQRHHFANKGLSSQSYGFSSSHVQMWELDHKEGWEPKNRCFQTGLLEKAIENPLDCKEIKPVNSKGNQPWIFIGRTDAGVESTDCLIDLAL